MQVHMELGSLKLLKTRGVSRLKLIECLIINRSLTHRPKSILLLNRKVKPRFWWLVAVVILVILVVLCWDKLVPTEWVTSRYMQAVVSGK